MFFLGASLMDVPSWPRSNMVLLYKVWRLNKVSGRWITVAVFAPKLNDPSTSDSCC